MLSQALYTNSIILCLLLVKASNLLNSFWWAMTPPSVSKLRYELNIIFPDLRNEIRQLCGVILLSHQAYLVALCLFSHAYNPTLPVLSFQPKLLEKERFYTILSPEGHVSARDPDRSVGSAEISDPTLPSGSRALTCPSGDNIV